MNAQNVISPDPTEITNNQKKRRQLLFSRGIEVATIILLSVTAMVTAFSAYEAARLGTSMSIKLGQANTRRVLASRAITTAGQQTMIDINLFTNWLNAYAVGNEILVQFYEARFRPEFMPAFQAWLATDPKNNPNAPKSPFSMPEYQLSKTLEAQQLDQEAAQINDDAMLANDKRDGYALVTVLLASVLFFVGISQRMKWAPLQVAAVLVGVFVFLIALIWMLILLLG